MCISCVVFHYLFIYFFLFFLFCLFSVFFEFNLTPSVIRQRWIVGCRPPTAHPSPRPPGPQAGPWALCYHRGSFGLQAGWGGGPLWFLPSSSSSCSSSSSSSSSLLLLLLSVTSIGGGPSAFSAIQLETGERCRLFCVHLPVCCVHPTSFFLSIFFKRTDTTLAVDRDAPIPILASGIGPIQRPYTHTCTLKNSPIPRYCIRPYVGWNWRPRSEGTLSFPVSEAQVTNRQTKSGPRGRTDLDL